MFVVKRLSKNGTWSAVSLIDKNGSFRGEARFETREEAEEYMEEYLKRVRNPQEVKVFNEHPKYTKRTASK